MSQLWHAESSCKVFLLLFPGWLGKLLMMTLGCQIECDGRQSIIETLLILTGDNSLRILISWAFVCGKIAIKSGIYGALSFCFGARILVRCFRITCLVLNEGS